MLLVQKNVKANIKCTRVNTASKTKRFSTWPRERNIVKAKIVFFLENQCTRRIHAKQHFTLAKHKNAPIFQTSVIWLAHYKSIHSYHSCQSVKSVFIYFFFSILVYR